MLRFASLLIAVVCLTCCVTLYAADPTANPTTQPTRRFDLSRFRQARTAFTQSTADTSKLKHMTWTVDGVTREALVYLPPNTPANAPVVFAYHGHGGTAEFSARKFDVHDLWPEAIAVYPQGLPTAVPQIDPTGQRAGWQKYVGDENDRDLKFFDAMLKSLKSDYKIDEKHVYVTGHSNGGFFAYVLWAARGDAIAGFAPVSAYLDVRDQKDMKPKPVLHVAGQKDPLVKFTLQEKTIDADRKLNGCDATGKPAGEFCTEYTSENGPPVIAYIHDGGHEVPAGAPKRIVAFFKSLAMKP